MSLAIKAEELEDAAKSKRRVLVPAEALVNLLLKARQFTQSVNRLANLSEDQPVRLSMLIDDVIEQTEI